MLRTFLSPRPSLSLPSSSERAQAGPKGTSTSIPPIWRPLKISRSGSLRWATAEQRHAACACQSQQHTGVSPTLMPSNLERARSGLRALSVRRDLMAPSSEYPNQFAVRLIMETWKEQPKGLAASQVETQVNHVPAAPALPSLPGTASGWWPLSCLGVRGLASSLCVPGGQLPPDVPAAWA